MSEYLNFLKQILNSSASEKQLRENAIQELIKVYPRRKEAYLAFALELSQTGETKRAIEFIDLAMERCSPDSDIYYYRARLATEILDFKTSIKFYKKCLRLNPHHRRANFNLAVDFLTTGRLVEGATLYHHREFPEETQIFSKIKKWKGENIESNVLIWAEQGLGDELMFTRLLPWIKTFKCQFTIQCDRRLLNLFSINFPWAKFIPRNQNLININEYDRQAPIGDLFVLFHTAIHKPIIKNHILKPITKIHLVDQLKSDKKNIGISWLSMNAEKGDKRSIPIELLVKCLSSKHHRIINLQYLTPESEIKKIRDFGFEIFNQIDCFQNIEEMAFIITNCDYVISIDNSTLHLAGSLGAPTIGLLPREANWRWLQQSEESYWYPSVRLIRQTIINDWSAPLERLSSIISQV